MNIIINKRAHSLFIVTLGQTVLDYEGLKQQAFCIETARNKAFSLHLSQFPYQRRRDMVGRC